MHNTINPLIIRIIACLAGLFFLFVGCGKKAEPPKPKVFTQKITMDKIIPQDRKSSPPRTGITEVAVLPPEVKVQETQPVSEDSKPVDSGAGKKSPAALAKAAETTPTSETAYAYSPKGKIDPFMPWYEDERPTSKSSVNKRLPLSPLEKVDLSQLKLVGIVLSASVNRALVEEATGKGFVITKGTYIGLNRGKVVRILHDRVIIEEAVQYGMSEAPIRRKELKLQKPPGDN